MSKRILVVGSLNMDLVVSVKHHPEPGDTVLGGDLQTFPGGKGANQAVAAAKAGGPETDAAMLGLVGTDAYGEALLGSLQEAGTDTQAVERTEGPSGVALIAVATGGENTIIVSPGANGALTPEHISDEAFEGVALVVMQLEVPLETVRHVAAAARAQNVPVMLNAAPIQNLPGDLLADLAYLVLNEGEAAFLGGETVEDEASALEAARTLAARGPTVIITLGAGGVVWADGEGEGRVSAFQVEAVDTTAAGDAFCGALAVQLAEDADLGNALRFASAAGALAATKEGAQPSLPSRADIEGLIEQA